MRLYDTATRGLVELPEPGERPIGMYFCGPTVYQRIHVGNARPFVVSMWLRRWLQERGHDVTLVENITDINDKIYAAAPGDSAKLAADAARWYIEDTDLLGLGRPDHEPLATETVPEIVALIEELIERDLAYEAGGDVYFRVDRFEDYGRLSGRHDDESAMRNPSEEEEQSSLKENPRDFALWKAHKEGEDTWWESPWGNGRPGWHIECSAMAEKHLGPVFEIHGGGLDLVFPHHENEIAQSRGAGREFARIWMHNGMLRLGGEKMSKSLGNLVSLRDAVEEWGRETHPDALPRRALAEADGLLRRDPCCGEGAGRGLPRGVPATHPCRAARGTTSSGRSRTTSTRRRLSPSCTSGATTTCCGAGSICSASSRSPRRRPRRPSSTSWPGSAPTARAGGDFDEADRLRQEIEAAGWEVRDVAGDSGYQLVPKR